MRLGIIVRAETVAPSGTLLCRGLSIRRLGKTWAAWARIRRCRVPLDDTGFGSSYAIRIDRGQLAANPPITDAQVQGNIISDPGQDGVLMDGKLTQPRPRYRYAFYLELPKPEEPDGRYPKNIHVRDNLFEAGADGVAKVPPPYQK